MTKNKLHINELYGYRMHDWKIVDNSVVLDLTGEFNKVVIKDETYNTINHGVPVKFKISYTTGSDEVIIFIDNEYINLLLSDEITLIVE